MQNYRQSPTLERPVADNMRLGPVLEVVSVILCTSSRYQTISNGIYLALARVLRRTDQRADHTGLTIQDPARDLDLGPDPSQ